MASRLTPLGFLVKWIVVPLSLGAVGYLFVGPRVDGKVANEIKDQVQKVTGTGDDKAPPEDEDKPLNVPAHNFTEPQIDVTVTALNTRQNKPKKKRRRKRPKPPVENPSGGTEPSITAPPSDVAPPTSDG